MRNFEMDYYKEYINYAEFLAEMGKAKINSTNYVNLDNRNTILAATDNTDFYWIFLWENWIEKTGVCDLYESQSSKFTRTKLPDKTNKELSKFKNFNLNPYRVEVVQQTQKKEDKKTTEEAQPATTDAASPPSPEPEKKTTTTTSYRTNRCIPIVDVSDFVTFFNGGQENKDFTALIKYDYGAGIKHLKNFDLYIDVTYPEIKNSLNGIFFDIINTMGYSPELYYAKKSFKKDDKSVITISYDSMDKEQLNIISKLISTIKNRDMNTVTTMADLKAAQIEISDCASRISKIVSCFIDMYTTAYNIIEQTSAPKGTDPNQINIVFGREDIGSLPIEETLMISQPPVTPSFKKSYIARQENLKPFLVIIMEYQVGADSENFITLNYFTIPYNNILSIEHSVKDHNMTVTLVDTEGGLSELFIQKMYAVSQKKNNALVEKNTVRALGEYRFYIEYGWSGPSTDDEEELLEEKVFVKTRHRGYIKSISSQYSFKGTEYTLNIIPNDLSNFKSGFNDTSILYFNQNQDANVSNNNPINVAMGLLTLFLLLSSPRENLFEKLNKQTEPNILFKIFAMVENTQIGNFEYTDGKGNKYKHYALFIGKEEKLTTDHGLNSSPKTKLIAESLHSKTPGTENRYMKSINFNDDNYTKLLSLCEKNAIEINAWIAACYIIWKTKKDQNMILCDNTGMFLHFDDRYNSNQNLYDNVIKIFNPLCLTKKEIDKITGDSNQKVYDYIIKETDLNPYFLSEIFNLEPSGPIKANEKEKLRPLTFLITQLNGVFNQIKNIGMNLPDVSQAKHNIYQGSDGVNLIYDILRPNDNEKKFISEYKTKIFSEGWNIYSYDDNDEFTRTNAQFDNFKFNVEKRGNKKQDYIVFYLTYISNPQKVAFLNCSLQKKISLLGKQLCQSYSFGPRISPKTRLPNKQFFTQGNSQLLREGSGDIIEFTVDPIDIGNFNSIMLANSNKNNISFNNVSSHSFVGGLYQNASKYYRTYRDINGSENKTKITQEMARIDLNYQSQTALKGSITMPGEPYWSNINLLMSKCIYLNIHYANGSRSSHSGIYYVSNVTQSIADGKFTTKLDLIRAPTFLSPAEKLVNKNKYVS